MHIFIGGKEQLGSSVEIEKWVEHKGYLAVNRQRVPTPENVTEIEQQQWWLLRKSHAAVFDVRDAGFRDGQLAAQAALMKLPTLLVDGKRSLRGEDVVGGWSREGKNVQQILHAWHCFLEEEHVYPHWQLYRNPHRGRYIAFEGLNSAGKDTQLEMVKDKLSIDRIDFWTCREPGTGYLGKQLRTLNQEDTPEKPVVTAEVSMLMAQRGQLVEKYLFPRLMEGQDAISNRSDGTSFSFQGAGRGEGIFRIAELNGYATLNVHPDLVILLQTHEDRILNRARDGVKLDRFEGEGKDFDRLCREGYERVLLLDRVTPPVTWYAFDATQTPEVIHEEILQVVRPLLARNGNSV